MYRLPCKLLGCEHLPSTRRCITFCPGGTTPSFWHVPRRKRCQDPPLSSRPAALADAAKPLPILGSVSLIMNLDHVPQKGNKERESAQGRGEFQTVVNATTYGYLSSLGDEKSTRPELPLMVIMHLDLNTSQSHSHMQQAWGRKPTSSATNIRVTKIRKHSGGGGSSNAMSVISQIWTRVAWCSRSCLSAPIQPDMWMTKKGKRSGCFFPGCIVL